MQIIKNIFKKRKNKKQIRNNSHILFSENKRQQAKKRKNFKLEINSSYIFNFFKKRYIPYFLIAFVIIIAATLYLVIGPLFRVQEIIIHREDSITNMDLSYDSLDSLRGSSIFDVDQDTIFKKLSKTQENIKSISVKTQFPSKVDINIASFDSLYKTIIQNKDYIILQNGSLIPHKGTKELEVLEVVKDIKRFLGYKKFFNQTELLRINEIDKKVKINFPHIRISKRIYYVNERELHLITATNLRIIFSVSGEVNQERKKSDINVTEQIRNLSIFEKQYKKINTPELLYIDLRIRNKIFFCTTENKYLCDRNIQLYYPKVETKKQEIKKEPELQSNPDSND